MLKQKIIEFQLNQQSPHQQNIYQLHKQSQKQSIQIHQQPTFKQPNQNSQQQQNLQNFKAPKSIIALTFYLFFTQGILLSIPATMPYVYSELPIYSILSVFSFATVPFSIKFILAPFIQKYGKVSYGKRKTWVVLSQAISSSIILLSSFFTQNSYALLFAILMFFVIFFIVLQGIALDALAIKQLRKAKIVSSILVTAQTLGNVLGSLILLKFTDFQFAKNIGLQHPITSPRIILIAFASCGFIPVIPIHFFYKQRKLQAQNKIKQKGFCQILKQYKIFLDKKGQFFRFVLMFLIYKQGYNLYIAGYEFQLVNKGFSRDILNTVTNISHIPISAAACLIGSKIQKFGILKGYMIYLIFQQCLSLLTVILFPMSIPAVALNVSLNKFLNTCDFLIGSIIIYSFPVTGVTAMYLAMFASAMNFGNLQFIQVKLTGVFGWHTCAIFGIGIQGVIIFLFPKLYLYCKNGTLDIQPELLQSSKQKKYKEQNQQNQENNNQNNDNNIQRDIDNQKPEFPQLEMKINVELSQLNRNEIQK